MDNKQLLFARIDQNLADYHDELIANFDRETIIAMAGRISTMEDAHISMKQYDFDDSALEYLLQFQNPLEVVADSCEIWRNDLGEMDFAIASAVNSRGANASYPLVGEPVPGTGWPRKFANVDILDTLGKIAGRTIVFHRNDFEIDKKALIRYANDEAPENKKLVWCVREDGTKLMNERDVFVVGSPVHTTLTEYIRPDDLLYFIELTGAQKGIITGNIYELPTQEYIERVRKTALRTDTVSINYVDNRQLDVTRSEYDDDRHRLMSEDGPVASVRFNPEDGGVLAAILRREQNRRDMTPPGKLAQHLKQISANQVKAETARIVAAFKSKTEPDSPKKTHYMVKVRLEFSIHGDMDALFDSVDKALNQDTLYFSGLNDEKGVYAFVKHDPDRQHQFGDVENDRQTSLLEPVYGKTLSVVEDLREKKRSLPQQNQQQANKPRKQER